MSTPRGKYGVSHTQTIWIRDKRRDICRENGMLLSDAQVTLYKQRRQRSMCQSNHCSLCLWTCSSALKIHLVHFFFILHASPCLEREIHRHRYRCIGIVPVIIIGIGVDAGVGRERDRDRNLNLLYARYCASQRIINQIITWLSVYLNATTHRDQKASLMTWLPTSDPPGIGLTYF